MGKCDGYTRMLQLNAPIGPVYTSPDKFLHGQNLAWSTLRLHGTGGTGRIFERLRVQVWDLKKSRSTFLPTRFRFRTDTCKHPNRATFCSNNAVKALNLVMFLPGCLEKVKQQSNQSGF